MNHKLNPFDEPFGTIFSDNFAVAEYENGEYLYTGSPETLKPFQVHPGSHGIHYASLCFEGLKAHKQPDDSIAIFRLEDHAQRFTKSQAGIQITPLETGLFNQMVVDTVRSNSQDVPPPPGSLYIRPSFFGTMQNIGAAAAPTKTGKFFVLNSPVGDYFIGGIRPLKLYVETKYPRTTQQFGTIKSGANYALALGPTLEAKEKYQVDQVLFANNDDVTETGAANFFLVDDNKLITRKLGNSFLHGITRDSVIRIGEKLGYQIEETNINLTDLKTWKGEAFLTGTAAVIAPVSSVIIEDETITYLDGNPGPNTLRLRETLTGIQQGTIADEFNWLTKI